MNNLKNKVIDKVSDVLSYPARRAAQKRILNSNKELEFEKSAISKGMSLKREGSEVIATPQARQKAALKAGYKIPKAPSSGVGVGGN